MLCDHLEGWDGEGGREGDGRGKRYGFILVCGFAFNESIVLLIEFKFSPIANH